MHSQLDKRTNDIHRRVIHGVDADSKLLVLHCDFSQDLAHAMTDQCMCEYFDIIASSLFICVAHFWDSVTNKRECKGDFCFLFQTFFHLPSPIFFTFLLRVQDGCLFSHSNNLQKVFGTTGPWKYFCSNTTLLSQLDSLMIQLFAYQTTTCCVVGGVQVSETTPPESWF